MICYIKYKIKFKKRIKKYCILWLKTIELFSNWILLLYYKLSTTRLQDCGGTRSTNLIVSYSLTTGLQDCVNNRSTIKLNLSFSSTKGMQDCRSDGSNHIITLWLWDHGSSRLVALESGRVFCLRRVKRFFKWNQGESFSVLIRNTWYRISPV